MSWNCPACASQIRRELTGAGDARPRPGEIYRCATCRLDLVLSDDGAKMVVAPLFDTSNDRTRRRRRDS